MEEATGFAPGAVAPFPLPNVDRVLIDQRLLSYDVVWVGAGSETHLAAMHPGVLVRLAHAQPMDAVQDSAYHSASRGDRLMRETETIWMNGEFIDWQDAKVHVGVHGLHYGTGVFEGIRCYETPDGPAIFRLREHLERLDNSAKLLHMELPYSVEEIRTAMHELIGRNGLAECYVRPFAFYGYGELGVHTKGNPVEVVIMSWPWANYLGDENASTGIRAKISSWKRSARTRSRTSRRRPAST